MHVQQVCIIAAYPALRLCDAGNIAALSARDVSNTELPHEFARSLFPISLSCERTARNSLYDAPDTPRISTDQSIFSFAPGTNEFPAIATFYRSFIIIFILPPSWPCDQSIFPVRARETVNETTVGCPSLSSFHFSLLRSSPDYLTLIFPLFPNRIFICLVVIICPFTCRVSLEDLFVRINVSISRLWTGEA